MKYFLNHSNDHRFAKKNRIYKFLLLAFVVCASCGLILYGASGSIIFFYKPADLINHQYQGVVRLGGIVKNGSIRYHDLNRISFILTDDIIDIVVEYSGMIPKLFKDRQGVVVKGTLQKSSFIATQILAKHDEVYFPKP